MTMGNLGSDTSTMLETQLMVVVELKRWTYGFDIRYIGTRTGNANSFGQMHNQNGTNVEAITVYQDGKVGINNKLPSSVLDVGGNMYYW